MMQASILAIFALTATACYAQLTSITAPTVSIVTYKTIRCSTYYASTRVKNIRRTTVGVTTNYPETIYPYVYENSTTTVSTCYSPLGGGVAVNIAAATQFPSVVYCTKSVEIVKATYVTSPVSTLTRTIITYPTTNPAGIQWAIYPNTQGADTDATYSQFNPELFQNATPWYHNALTTIGGLSGTATPDSPFVKIYNSAVAFNQSYFTLNHRWYLNAPQTGTYTISIPAANDIALVWTGPFAYSNWSRNNSVQAVTSGNTTHTSYTFQATAGQYLPMRVVYAQASDAYAFQFTLSAPDGTVLLGPSSAASQSVIQYSCAGYSGPAVPWPQFGEEY